MISIVKRNITAVFVLISICCASEGERPDSNREIFFRLCQSAVDEMDAAGVRQFGPLVLSTGSDIPSSHFRQQIIRCFVSKDIPLFLRQDSTAAALELNVQESSVFYGEVYTESFFGERRTVRTVNLGILATVISHSDGQVRFSRLVTSSYVDTVAYSAIDYLNEGAPPLTGYRTPELTFFDTLLEPAIVTIASGVVIYLFFTIRS